MMKRGCSSSSFDRFLPFCKQRWVLFELTSMPRAPGLVKCSLVHLYILCIYWFAFKMNSLRISNVLKFWIRFVDYMVLGWMYAYYLVPGHHIYARRLPETPGSRTIDHRSIPYEWGQGSAIFPETDVWKFKTRRLNLEHSRGRNQFRRLFQVFQTSVLGFIPLELIQTSEWI